MSHRTHEWNERLVSHLENREWTQEDREHFLHMVGRSTIMSAQGALAILEFQESVDERIEAQKKYDELFTGECYQPSLDGIE